MIRGNTPFAISRTTATLGAFLVIILIATTFITIRTEGNLASTSSTATTNTTSTTLTATTNSNATVSTHSWNDVVSGLTVLSKASSMWNFTLTVNDSKFTAGEPEALWGNLTYTGKTGINVTLWSPLLYVMLNTSSGKELWYSSSSTYFQENVTVTSGSTFSQVVRLPPSIIPGAYLVQASPSLFNTSGYWLGAPYAAVASLEVVPRTMPQACPPYPTEASTFNNNSFFENITGGLCFQFTSSYYEVGPSYNESSVFVFEYYNGSIFYPCLTYPEPYSYGELQIAAYYLNSTVSRLVVERYTMDTFLIDVSSCPIITFDVGVVSLTQVVSPTPGQTAVNVTLEAIDYSGPVTSLSVLLTIDGRNYTVVFTSVSPSTPLQPFHQASQILKITGPVGLYEIYPMTILYTSGNSTTIRVDAQVEIVRG